MESIEKMLVEGRTDIVPQFGEYTADPYGFSNLMDIVATQEVDRDIILVPIAAELPAWSLPLRVFPARLWLLLLGAAVAYALAWRVVARESLGASVAAALRAFSSCGGSPQDRVRATRMRLQLAAALLASAVVVAAVYQGRLFDLITNPQHEPEIDTFDQLAEQSMTILVPNYDCMKHVQSILPNNPVRQYNNIRELAAILQNNTETHYAVHTSFYEWYMRTLFFESELRFHRDMRQSVSSYQPQLCSRRNWPWYEITKIFFLQMEDNGLLRKWTNDLNKTLVLLQRLEESPNDIPEESQRGPKELALGDMVSHFQLLCAGVSASALAFCAELWRGHRARERLRRCSRLVRAQLSRGWRRMHAGVRQADEQNGQSGQCTKAKSSPPQP